MSDQPSTPPARINDLSTAALLEALGDVPRSVPSLAATWCNVVGLLPGTCRVPAGALYAEWLAWWRNQADYVDYGRPGLQAWGVYMASQYRRGKGNSGKFYYVTRNAKAP